MQRVQAMLLTIKKLYTMDETIEKLRAYANISEDWYINKQLDILEKQNLKAFEVLRLQKKIAKLEKQIKELNKYK